MKTQSASTMTWLLQIVFVFAQDTALSYTSNNSTRNEKVSAKNCLKKYLLALVGRLKKMFWNKVRRMRRKRNNCTKTSHCSEMWTQNLYFWKSCWVVRKSSKLQREAGYIWFLRSPCENSEKWINRKILVNKSSNLLGDG